MEAYKNKEVRPFPEDVQGQKQDEILEDKREIGKFRLWIELLPTLVLRNTNSSRTPPPVGAGLA